MIFARMSGPFTVRSRSAATVAVGLVLLMSLLSGCMTMPPESPTERLSREQLLALAEQSGGRFVSVRGMAKGTYRRDGASNSATQAVLAEFPDRLRIETFGLFGAPALMAATDGDRTAVILPGEGRAFVGPAGSGFLQRVLKLPLTVGQIVDLLLVRPELIRRESASVAYPVAGISRLVLTAGRVVQHLDYNGTGQLVGVVYQVDHEPLSIIRYGAYRDGYPDRISIEFPGPGIAASLEFTEVDVNITHKNGVFTLVPPTSYRVEPIPVTDPSNTGS